MVKVETNSGKVYNLSVKTFGKRVGGFFKSITKIAIDTAKDLLIQAVAYVHKKLSQLEDYLLGKLSDLGTYADEKITERIEEPIDEAIPE